MGTNWEEQSLYQRFVFTRQPQMERDREPFNDTRNEIVKYLRPDLTNDPSIKGKQDMDLVDCTGRFDAETMSKWFVGNLVGPTLHWIRYRMGERRFDGDDEMNAFLQRSAKFMLEDVYPYPYSNYYEVNNHLALDGITVGSPVMLLEIDPKTHKKTCILPHYTENYLMRDWFGNDTAYHRKWKVTNLAAKQAFGDSLPFSIKQELQQGLHLTEHTYLMCIARAGDPIFQYENTKPKNNIPLIRPWMQMWFNIDTTGADEQLPLNYQLTPDRILPLSSPGYWQKPFHSWHYWRLPSETYARTPGWTSLPDVKGLNAAWRTVHDVAQASARPATIALEEMKGRLQLGAEGVTWVTQQQYNSPPKAYENNSKYPWAMDFIDRRTKTVGRHFFADMARMIQNFAQDHTQHPTAYQLSQMISETLVLIGPAITSFAGPYLQSVDDMFLQSEIDSGRFERETQPPDAVYESDGKLNPVFTGPLLEGLRQAMVAKRIQMPLTMAAPIFEVWPNSKDKIRAADLVELLLESADFPQSVIVGADDYAEMQEAKMAEQRQQQNIENMVQLAGAVPGLQGETSEDSPLGKIAAAA